MHDDQNFKENVYFLINSINLNRSKIKWIWFMWNSFMKNATINNERKEIMRCKDNGIRDIKN